jgi:hypothetical protein
MSFDQLIAPLFGRQKLALECLRYCAPHKPMRKAGYDHLARRFSLPRPIEAHAVLRRSISPVRHCVRVIVESRDTMDRMDEFPVGVVYSK